MDKEKFAEYTELREMAMEILAKVEMITKYPYRYPIGKAHYRQTLIKKLNGLLYRRNRRVYPGIGLQ